MSFRHILFIILLVLFSCNPINEGLSSEELNLLMHQIHKTASEEGFDCKIVDRMIYHDLSLTVLTENYDIIKEYFSEDDIDFIKSQNTQPEILKLDSSLMYPFKLVSGDSVRAEQLKEELNGVYKKFGRLCHYGPLLFSLDRKKVLVSYNMWCGSVCGEAYYVIYILENGIWVKQIKFDHIVS